MTWGRLPIFVWSILATSALLTLATPTLVAAGLFGILDRTAQTAFFVNEHGGSSFLWENLFWFFGHPEVYIMALPGFGIVAEMLPVFCRKPLFGYRVAAAGMLGCRPAVVLRLAAPPVPERHRPRHAPAFHADHRADLHPDRVHLPGRPGDPVESEDPHGCAHAVRASGMFFNFLIGGVTGVFLSDVPVDVTVHGSFFVLAHFHYTIMGGLIFAFFGGVYYWTPKMTGRIMDQQVGARSTSGPCSSSST